MQNLENIAAQPSALKASPKYEILLVALSRKWALVRWSLKNGEFVAHVDGRITFSVSAEKAGASPYKPASENFSLMLDTVIAMSQDNIYYRKLFASIQAENPATVEKNPPQISSKDEMCSSGSTACGRRFGTSDTRKEQGHNACCVPLRAR